MALLPFQQGEALADAFNLLGPIAGIILVVAAMLWFVAWLTRYVEYLKSLESRWMDAGTLDFVRRGLEAVWITLMAIVVLGIASTQSEPIRDTLVAVVLRLPALFFVAFVLFTAELVVRLLHRFAAYLRGELKTKPRRAAPRHALAFTEIVLKYVLYIGALSLAVLGGVRALPSEDQAFIGANVGTLPAPDRAVGLGILIALLVVFVADRFVNSIFEDLKGRTRKFSARVLEEFKSLARYAVWLISAVVVLFVLLGGLLGQEQLVVFAVGFIAFFVLIAVLAFDPVRNALAGVSLIRADPFDVGDRVKIGDDLVCDIVSMGLATTQVRTLRGEAVNLPNAGLLGATVTNFSRSRPTAIAVDVAIPFEVSHGRVDEILLRVASETRGVVSEPAPRVLGTALDGGSIRYEVLAFTDAPSKMQDVRSALIFGIQDAFREAGIRPQGPGASALEPPSAG